MQDSDRAPSPDPSRPDPPSPDGGPETGAGTAGPAGSTTSADRLWAWALGAGLLAGLAGWLAGEAAHSAFRPKVQIMMTALGPMSGTTTAESKKADTRNAVLAFALQGACLGLAMGLAGGLARGSARAAAMAGLAGVVLGAPAGLGASLALQPVYYGSLRLDQLEQSLTMPLLVHGGIWAAVGAAGGIAFGLGLGGRPDRVARAAIGGLVGALLAAFAYEFLGAMAFPDAQTTRPVSLTSTSRLMARLLVALLAAAGTVALVVGEPAPKPRPASDLPPA